MLKNDLSRDFSDSPVVKTSPPNAGGMDSVPGSRTKIPSATQRSQNKNFFKTRISLFKNCFRGTSLAVQWLRLCLQIQG